MTSHAWSLAAYGRSGQVELELDSSDSEPTAYMLTVTLQPVQLRFAVEGPLVVAKLIEFLRDYHGLQKLAELQLGMLGNSQVTIIKDDEFADRYFLRATSDGLVDVEIAGAAAGDLLRAADDLKRSGRN